MSVWDLPAFEGPATQMVWNGAALYMREVLRRTSPYCIVLLYYTLYRIRSQAASAVPPVRAVCAFRSARVAESFTGPANHSCGGTAPLSLCSGTWLEFTFVPAFFFLCGMTWLRLCLQVAGESGPFLRPSVLPQQAPWYGIRSCCCDLQASFAWHVCVCVCVYPVHTGCL